MYSSQLMGVVHLTFNFNSIFLFHQLNISIYSQSSFDLSFNLYPLKAGWQELPEFEIRYNNTQDQDDEQSVETNAELQSLVNRWMPKKVFILVSIIVGPIRRSVCRVYSFWVVFFSADAEAFQVGV